VPGAGGATAADEAVHRSPAAIGSHSGDYRNTLTPAEAASLTGLEPALGDLAPRELALGEPARRLEGQAARDVSASVMPVTSLGSAVKRPSAATPSMLVSEVFTPFSDSTRKAMT
jgi:hypothetical protein